MSGNVWVCGWFFLKAVSGVCILASWEFWIPIYVNSFSLSDVTVEGFMYRQIVRCNFVLLEGWFSSSVKLLELEM